MNKLIVSTLFLMLIATASASAGQIGEKAPSFALPDMHGRTISLEQFSGKVLFVTFWAPWCITCKVELPELDALYRKYGKDGLEVMGVSVTGEEEVSTFLRKVPVNLPILIDKKNEASDAYGVTSLPTGFIIGRDGIIRWVHKGFSKDMLPFYEKEIKALLIFP